MASETLQRASTPQSPTRPMRRHGCDCGATASRVDWRHATGPDRGAPAVGSGLRPRARISDRGDVPALMFERIIGNWRRVVAAEMRVAAVGHCRQRRRRWGRHAPPSSSSSKIQDNVLYPCLTVAVVTPSCASTRHDGGREVPVAARRSVRTRDRVRKSFKAIGIQKTNDPGRCWHRYYASV